MFDTKNPCYKKPGSFCFFHASPSSFVWPGDEEALQKGASLVPVCAKLGMGVWVGPLVRRGFVLARALKAP